MSEFQIFDYKGKKIRTVEIDGKPWFCLKDICDILGISDNRTVAARLDNDELTRVKTASGGQMREMTFVSESGLYNVILRSDKSEAKPFRKHVTSVILPTIRKTGGYVADENMFIDHYLPGADENVKQLFRASLATIENLNGKVEQLTKETAEKDKVIETQAIDIRQKDTLITEAKPKIEFYDTVADSRENISMSKFAKLLCKKGANVGQNRLFAWFRENGYLRHNNEPYQQYVNAGYFYVHEYQMYIKGVSVINTKTLITGKGQQYFFKRVMRDFGVIEQGV